MFRGQLQSDVQHLVPSCARWDGIYIRGPEDVGGGARLALRPANPSCTSTCGTRTCIIAIHILVHPHARTRVSAARRMQTSPSIQVDYYYFCGKKKFPAQIQGKSFGGLGLCSATGLPLEDPLAAVRAHRELAAGVARDAAHYAEDMLHPTSALTKQIPIAGPSARLYPPGPRSDFIVILPGPLFVQLILTRLAHLLYILFCSCYSACLSAPLALPPRNFVLASPSLDKNAHEDPTQLSTSWQPMATARLALARRGSTQISSPSLAFSLRSRPNTRKLPETLRMCAEYLFVLLSMFLVENLLTTIASSAMPSNLPSRVSPTTFGERP